MDSKSTCLKSPSVCENSNGSVHEAEIVSEAKGETSDSVSKEQIEVEDPIMVKDGVKCSNISTHTVQEEEVKVKEFHHMVDLSGYGEKICRICHFGSDQSPKAETADNKVPGKSISPDLIEIGCECKNELGLAHFHCAEAWFKLKGNNVCEICGCTAKNVTVSVMREVRDNIWDERIIIRGRGQSCCILTVILFTILLLHWFFKKFSFHYKTT